MTVSVLPTKAEARILASWRTRLDRLDEDVTGQLQILACLDEFGRALSGRRSRFIGKWIMTMFMHSAAIGVRRLFKDGKRRQNVSLEHLLVRMRDHPAILRKQGNAQAIRQWLQLNPSDRFTDRQIVSHLNSEIERLKTSIAEIKTYADTIAHLQRRQVGMSKGKLRGALRSLDETVSTCYSVLDLPRPAKNEGEFVSRFRDEIFALLD